MKSFLERLRSDILVGDGGTGSMLFQSIPDSRCLELANVEHGDAVLDTHLRFIRAGSHVIETNTFGANRYKLQSHGLTDRVREINSSAVKLAREAREISGKEVYISGSIGPTGLHLDPDRVAKEKEGLLAAFREQAAALDERGVDLFMVETFASTAECLLAIQAVSEVSSLPVVASLTFPDEWNPRPHIGPSASESFAAVIDAGVQAIGLNCSMGPSQVLEVLDLVDLPDETYISVQPNVGVPEQRGGRFVFPRSTPEYFAYFAKEAVRRGARIVGGCCGTEPHHIEAICNAVADLEPVSRRSGGAVETLAPTEPEAPVERVLSPFAAKLKEQKFVNVVQLDPPKGTNTELMLGAVKKFLASGVVDAVDLNSNPMARLHMDSLWGSAEIQTLGMETIPHITPRDASLMGLESNLLGAWRAGIHTVLAVTGDPSQIGDYPGAHDVYQTDSVGLCQILTELNEGRDWAGNAIGDPPSFTIGVAVNPNAEDLEKEADRFRQKVDNGAHFAMTQVFFEWSCWERFLDRFGGKLPIPVLIAVWPLTSYRLALRLHNEVPGIEVPREVQERLERAGSDARAAGFDLAREIYAESKNRAEGVYVIAPFKNPAAALEIIAPDATP